jgi:hypothetical protein
LLLLPLCLFTGGTLLLLAWRIIPSASRFLTLAVKTPSLSSWCTPFLRSLPAYEISCLVPLPQRERGVHLPGSL